MVVLAGVQVARFLGTSTVSAREAAPDGAVSTIVIQGMTGGTDFLPEAWPGILERPLFAPDRRMVRAAEPVAALAGYVVVGIAVSDAAASAVLRGPDGKSLRLLPGRIVKGWTVEEIETGRVILSRAGQQRVLPLDLKRLHAATAGQAKGTTR